MTTSPDHQVHPTGHPYWVPMTPEQIRRRAFRPSGWSRRGYEREDVDAFLTRIADDISRWSWSYAQADAEIHRLRYYFRRYPPEADPSTEHEMSAEAVRILERAQAYADQLITDAEARAEMMLDDARARAQALVEQAVSWACPDGAVDGEAEPRPGALGRTIAETLAHAITRIDEASVRLRALSDAVAPGRPGAVTTDALPAALGDDGRCAGRGGR